MNFEPLKSGYYAEIVKMSKPRKHSNADRLLCWNVFGFNVITDLTTEEGDLRIFFPIECQIADKLLHFANLYREKDRNFNKGQAGYFDVNRRVKALTLRGEKSQGVVLPLSVLECFKIDISELKVGDRFDYLNKQEVCKKYFIPIPTPKDSGKKKNSKVEKRRESKLVEGQFRFHEDTDQFGRNLHMYYPDDYVTITYKQHGTSGISSHVLCRSKKKWYHKVFGFIGLQPSIKYSLLYSARRVIKNDFYSSKNHFYKHDIWEAAHQRLASSIPKGYTLYYEIVGFLPDGKYIQADYDYGCQEGNFDVYIYRGTYTSSDGTCIELSTEQLRAFCKKNNLNHVPVLYQGQLNSLVSCKDDEYETLLKWREELREFLVGTYLEKDCYMCSKVVPTEGVVIRKEGVHPEFWYATKLKSAAFYERETKLLDSGEADIESLESSESNI